MEHAIGKVSTRITLRSCSNSLFNLCSFVRLFRFVHLDRLDFLSCFSCGLTLIHTTPTAFREKVSMSRNTKKTRTPTLPNNTPSVRIRSRPSVEVLTGFKAVRIATNFQDSIYIPQRVCRSAAYPTTELTRFPRKMSSGWLEHL